MEKSLGKEFSGSKKQQFLKDNCDAVENFGYMKSFTPDEIETLKEGLADTSIAINDINIEKKRQSELFKLQLKPLETEKVETLRKLKEKSEFVTELCYKFVDEDSRIVGYYNSEGDLVSARPMRMEELQKTIKFESIENEDLNKTGTEN